jgi:hypothetical protein
MRRRVIPITLASALAVTAIAVAASVARDPARLALQRADAPRNVDLSPGVDPVDPEAIADLDVPGLKAADYSYAWPAGGAGRHWRIAGSVFVAPSRSGAQNLYLHATKLRYGLPFIDLLYPPRDQAQLRLPSYGDEQLGLAGYGDGAEATLYVRRGVVVWGLSVTHWPSAWKPTRAAVVAQLRLYARKQAARVGRG